MLHRARFSAPAFELGFRGARLVADLLPGLALALIAAGADASDTLTAAGPNCPTIIAATLAAIVAPRRKPIRLGAAA